MSRELSPVSLTVTLSRIPVRLNKEQGVPPGLGSGDDGTEVGPVPPRSGALAEPDRVVRLALAAEGPGWDGFFLWDRILALPGMAAADPWAIMAAVAQATARVRLGMPHRSPAGPECSPGRRLPSTGSLEAVWS